MVNCTEHNFYTPLCIKIEEEKKQNETQTNKHCSDVWDSNSKLESFEPEQLPHMNCVLHTSKINDIHREFGTWKMDIMQNFQSPNSQYRSLEL